MSPSIQPPKTTPETPEGSRHAHGATLARLLTRQLSPLAVSAAHWAEILAQARAQQLAGRLAEVTLGTPEAAALDPRLQSQLRSAGRIANGHQHSMRWELNRLAAVFCQTGDRPILLKGAAYCAHRLDVARGRHYGDVDLLVAEDRLPHIETALRFAGYAPQKTSAYDQHYYRTWMHEIPPMQHIKRGTSLDVHFRLIPRTSRVVIDHRPLLDECLPARDAPAFDVLGPAPMLLHSMVHLYTESEFPQGLRNLFDIHLLLIEFEKEKDFINHLSMVARQAGLETVLRQTLNWRQRMFGALSACATLPAHLALSRPQRWVARLIETGLDPEAAQRRSRRRQTALGLLYLRGHWLRMPTRLLAGHLWHQARSKWRVNET